MRESFFEKVTLGFLFKATSTQNQDSRNEFRESAHVLHHRHVASRTDLGQESEETMFFSVPAWFPASGRGSRIINVFYVEKE